MILWVKKPQGDSKSLRKLSQPDSRATGRRQTGSNFKWSSINLVVFVFGVVVVTVISKWNDRKSFTTFGTVTSRPP